MKYKSTQQGATLLVVLFLMLLIMVIGTLAMRNSLTSLNIATNAQAQQLLFQNNDAALFELENPDFNKSQFNQAAIFGTFLSSESNLQSKDKILVSCYRGDLERPFNLTSEIIISEQSLNTKGIAGYCTATTFSTARSAVISQVYIQHLDKKNQNLENPKLEDESQVEALKTTNKGTGLEEVTATLVPLQVGTISIMPGFSTASNEQINSCFQNTLKNAVTCFQSLNIPYNVQHAHYLAGNNIQDGS